MQSLERERKGMKFVDHDLGYRKTGEIVEVTLSGSAANVQLMDAANLSNYRNGRRYRYTGGLARSSPVRLPIPHAGNWHVAVDMRGLRGSVRSSVRVLPGPLPDIRERSLADVPTLVRNDENDTREYDVFISHASEDKEVVARPLCTALRETGLTVWFDDLELRIGDSLRRKIDRGVANSRFGVVVLSPSFMAKGWTNYELDGLVSRTVSGEQILLPIWHDLTKQEVIDYSPSLADKVARSTATHTLAEIAAEIAEVIQAG